MAKDITVDNGNDNTRGNLANRQPTNTVTSSAVSNPAPVVSTPRIVSSQPAEVTVPANPIAAGTKPIKNTSVDNSNGNTDGQYKNTTPVNTQPQPKPEIPQNNTPTVVTPTPVKDEPKKEEPKPQENIPKPNKRGIPIGDDPNGNGTTGGNITVNTPNPQPVPQDIPDIPNSPPPNVPTPPVNVPPPPTNMPPPNVPPIIVEPPKPEMKHGTAIVNTVESMATQSMHAATQSLNRTDAVSSTAFSISAGAGKDAMGGAGVATVGIDHARRLSETGNAYAIAGANLGMATQAGKNGVVGNLHAGIGTSLNEGKTQLNAILSGTFNGASQTKDNVTTAKQSLSIGVNGSHQISDNVHLNAGASIAQNKYNNGDKDTLVRGTVGMNYHSESGGVWGLGASGDKNGVGGSITYSKTVTNQRLQEMPVFAQGFTQKTIETQSSITDFNMEFRSPFKFDKDDLQKVPEWHKMTEIIATTKLANGLTPLQEAVKLGMPIVISAAADVYGTDKYNEGLSQRRADALHKNFIDNLKANHTAYGISMEDINKLNIKVEPLGERTATVSQDMVNSHFAKMKAENPKMSSEAIHNYIKDNITNVDRYTGIRIDKTNHPDALKIETEKMGNVSNQLAAIGAKMHVGKEDIQKHTQTIEVPTGPEKVGSVVLNRKGNVVDVKDGDGNTVKDLEIKSGLMQKFQEQQAGGPTSTSAFDANALNKAVSGQQALDAAKAAEQTQQTLTNENRGMKLH